MARKIKEAPLVAPERREKEGPKAGMLFARGVCHRGTLHYTIKDAWNNSDGQLEFYVPHLPRGPRGPLQGDLQLTPIIVSQRRNHRRLSRNSVRIKCREVSELIFTIAIGRFNFVFDVNIINNSVISKVTERLRDFILGRKIV